MARNLEIGDLVYVPRGKVGLEFDSYSSFYRTKVVDKQGNSVKVDLPYNNVSDWLSSQFVRKYIKVAIFAIGDMETELTLIDPLAKTILHHFRLLLGDDEILSVKIRSMPELEYFWCKEQEAFSHVIFIGHGSDHSIKFGVDGWVDAKRLGDSLYKRGASKKHFLFLCCQTGHAAFAKKFSLLPVCEDIVAPYHSVHGAIASQFCQTYSLLQFLEGRTSKVAYKNARDATPGGVIFKFWDNGRRG